MVRRDPNEPMSPNILYNDVRAYSSLLCSALGVVADELPTVKRRLILVFELVLLKLELDLRRPPSRGPEGGRPVERFNSFRKDRPQD